MFALIATAEAILRLDFNRRTAGRLKDPLARRFRLARAARGDKIRLDEDILVNISQAFGMKLVVGDFRGVLNLRHWLAHGRDWNPKIGRRYTPDDVFEVSKRPGDALPR